MCVCVCRYGYAFRHALRYRAESWHGGRGRAHEVWGTYSKQLHLRSKVIQGSICLKNALWLPNLVRKTPWRAYCIAGVRGHAGVIWSQPGVILLRNILWPPNLVGRIPDQIISIAGVKGHVGSFKFNQGSICLAMPYGHQIWWEEPLTRAQCIAGVKGHAGVSQGQPEVKFLRNALWPPNLVERTPDQSAMHWWDQRSCRGQLRSTRGKIA